MEADDDIEIDVGETTGDEGIEVVLGMTIGDKTGGVVAFDMDGNGISDVPVNIGDVIDEVVVEVIFDNVDNDDVASLDGVGDGIIDNGEVVDVVVVLEVVLVSRTKFFVGKKDNSDSFSFTTGVVSIDVADSKDNESEAEVMIDEVGDEGEEIIISFGEVSSEEEDEEEEVEELEVGVIGEVRSRRLIPFSNMAKAILLVF